MLRCLLVALLVLSVLQLSSAVTPRTAHVRSRRGTHPVHHPVVADTPNFSVVAGAPEQILAYQLIGGQFAPTSNSSISNTAPTWQVFKEPNFMYSIDGMSTHTRMFIFNTSTGSVSPQPAFTGRGGSVGVVHLLFNLDRTRMLGASYGQGVVDVWDTSSADGKFYIMDQITLEGPVGPVVDRGQGQHRAHATALETSGRFFVVNDLGGDSLHILSAQDGKVHFQSRVQVQPVGCGPRHGAFLTLGGRGVTAADDVPGLATHYVVACEISSEVLLFSLSTSTGFVDGGEELLLNLTQVQTLSSYGAAFPPANPSTAAAGELVVSNDQKHVYVSNRLSGNDTDSIAHFAFESNATAAGGAQLRFVDTVSCLGLVPRGMALSADPQQSRLFVGNQNGTAGLVAFARDVDSGSVDPNPVAQLANSFISPVQNNGPQSIISMVL